MAGTTGAQMETADEGGMARWSDGIHPSMIPTIPPGGPHH